MGAHNYWVSPAYVLLPLSTGLTSEQWTTLERFDRESSERIANTKRKNLKRLSQVKHSITVAQTEQSDQKKGEEKRFQVRRERSTSGQGHSACSRRLLNATTSYWVFNLVFICVKWLLDNIALTPHFVFA